MDLEPQAAAPAAAAADLRTAEGFRQAALAHRRGLFRVAARMLDAQAAEDALQEAFVRAFAARHRYRGEASPFAWLCAVLLNVCRDELRKRSVKRRLRLDRVLEPGEAPARDAGPQQALEDAERAAHLREAIAALPRAQREALVLVSLEGVPVRDAARALGSTEAAVWQALSRGRATLRARLSEVKP